MTSKAFLLLRLAILKHGGAAVAALLLASLAAAPAAADPVRQAPASPGDVLLSYAPVDQKAQPAVVNVYASRVEKRPKNPLLNDPFFERFFGGGGRPGGSTARSLGSGVLRSTPRVSSSPMSTSSKA